MVYFWSVSIVDCAGALFYIKKKSITAVIIVLIYVIIVLVFTIIKLWIVHLFGFGD